METEIKKEDIITIVDGYQFQSKEDAELAEMELKKISYLREHMGTADVDTVLKVYQKALETRTFQTPVGLSFMHELYSSLEAAGLKGTIKPVPTYHSYTNKTRRETKPAKERVQQAKKKEKVDKFAISVWLNILLVLLVIGMFFIAKTGDNPNVINYEKAVQDKYATWEQQLTERENVIREKELSLIQEN